MDPTKIFTPAHAVLWLSADRRAINDQFNRALNDLGATKRTLMTALAPMASAFSARRTDDEKMLLYALHLMIRTQALPAATARRQSGFDLDQAIAAGKADFGQGKLIDLELRVRGYLATLISVCPLSESQRLRDEPEGSPLTLRVQARLPSTGQLLRWLLGAGDNLEVVAPTELRQVLAAQAEKMAAFYRPGAD